jgi:hypothetical protein
VGRVTLHRRGRRRDVALVSRHGRPLGRYFPEVVAGLQAVGRDCMLDGELVIVGAGGFDFAALLARVHPSKSCVERLAREPERVVERMARAERGARVLVDWRQNDPGLSTVLVRAAHVGDLFASVA